MINVNHEIQSESKRLDCVAVTSGFFHGLSGMILKFKCDVTHCFCFVVRFTICPSSCLVRMQDNERFAENRQEAENANILYSCQNFDLLCVLSFT